FFIEIRPNPGFQPLCSRRPIISIVVIAGFLTMNRTKRSFYLSIKNFLTDDSMVVTPLLDNDTAELNPTALQLLVNAPINYKTSDSDVNVFLDKHNFERDLPNGSYQIQHY